MKKAAVLDSLFLVLALTLLTGCAGSNATVPNPAPLSSANINLVFVVSEDLAYSDVGDIDRNTANLTPQGLQRSLLIATFLQQSVLGTQNVSGVYALAPMTHLQTSGNYPDLVPLESIEQFAMLNQITLSSDLAGGSPYSGQNYPIDASYASGAVPSGVWVPPSYCPNCQGMDFNDQGGDNEALATGIIKANVAGYYVFSAPWETTRALLANINQLQGYNLNLPATYRGANYIYAVSISPSGNAGFNTFNSNVTPPSTYPVLPSGGVVSAACTAPTPASITVTGGVAGAVLPAGINTDETFYLVRHAEAHPQGYWSDNNYVGAGQWRALNLPYALSGMISPDQVWSWDPAQFSQGTVSTAKDQLWSGVEPTLTIAPYAIANHLPFQLMSSFSGSAANASQLTQEFFFTGDAFSNHKVLFASTFQQIPQIVNALLATYYPNGGAPAAPVWSSSDYDSVWILTFDDGGNLAADFTHCQGVDSAALPAAAPQF